MGAGEEGDSEEEQDFRDTMTINIRKCGWFQLNWYNWKMIHGRGGGLLYYLQYGFKIRHRTKDGLLKIL